MSTENPKTSRGSLNGLRGSAARRHGNLLEMALLEAAWKELTSVSFGEFTIEGAAAQAGTSRSVLYRRWPTKQELAVAAFCHHLKTHPVAIPNTGNLREDLVEYLTSASAERSDLVDFFAGIGMKGYFEETQTSITDLRNQMFPDGICHHEILRRAIERGEIDSTKLTTRVSTLPADLVRHEAIMTRKPVPRIVIEEIIDQIFFPLVRF